MLLYDIQFASNCYMKVYMKKKYEETTMIKDLGFSLRWFLTSLVQFLTRGSVSTQYSA